MLLTKSRKIKDGTSPRRETGELTSHPSLLFLCSFYSQHILLQPVIAYFKLSSSPVALSPLSPLPSLPLASQMIESVPLADVAEKTGRLLVFGQPWGRGDEGKGHCLPSGR